MRLTIPTAPADAADSAVHGTLLRLESLLDVDAFEILVAEADAAAVAVVVALADGDGSGVSTPASAPSSSGNG